jgi:hypothetical protein
MVETQRERGLPSLNQARAERRGAMRRGRYSLRGELVPRFWLWAAVILASAMVIYWKFSQGQLESEKSGIMAKQRAVAAALSPDVIPHTEKIEGWVRELSGDWSSPFIDPKVDLERIQRAPGIYFRIRREAGADSELLRKEGAESLLDGFVACMFVREGEPDPRQGPPCDASVDCEPGLLCNEYDTCTPPPRPFNLRLAYAALHVLDSSWTDELHEATNDLKVRAFERQLDRVSKNDVPIAVRMIKQAELFTLVVDEPPNGDLPAKLDGYETIEQRIQRAPHHARVAVWDIRSGKQLVRLRALADGKFVPVGKAHVSTVPADERSEEQQRSLAAQQRQANSCALALSVKTAIHRRIAEQRKTPAPSPVSPSSEGATKKPK